MVLSLVKMRKNTNIYFPDKIYFVNKLLNFKPLQNTCILLIKQILINSQDKVLYPMLQFSL